MKKKIITALILSVSALMLTACGDTCKLKRCDEEVYKDGYCKEHYEVRAGVKAIKDEIKDGIKDMKDLLK